ncbi:uncharacterized protein LOC131942348 isoform X1 [Physella acuta]|uniref:uncharacterized protein LOC131942348 isoform X1 n=1 Tax=Physella acuta TaxID=109671 RepID=UPI0027DD6F29|nr:uncharacterized protein LOC131942348 isoform X1 [Physella acuta]
MKTMSAAVDTMTTKLASDNLSRQFSGAHEVQECFQGQGEADLHTHLRNCTKNPDHLQFIPVNELTIDNFPTGCHDNDLYNFTKAQADLTVRIAVKFTSPDRPEFVPGTKDPYPCYNTRGQNSLRTGTGKVERFVKCTGTCPCPECEVFLTPSQVWWKIGVLTARHVLFDESEVRQSSCRLWFDEENCPVVKIYGLQAGALSDLEEDWCRFNCVTDDAETANKLGEMIERFNLLGEMLKDTYKNRSNVDKLTIIVSHPHGCSKQVSVGHWVHRREPGGHDTCYTYTTCTCPGSSGALVYRLGCDISSSHLHCGANAGGSSYSGVEWEFGL